jgi:hypothetical protein
VLLRTDSIVITILVLYNADKLKEYIDKIDFESPYINRIKYVREIITILESG